MPPTCSALALVWLPEHLSLVKLPLEESEDELDGDVLSDALFELSDPQAVRAMLRTAVPAINLPQVAVLDRFTG